MALITEQLIVEVEVEGVTVKGKLLSTSEKDALRVKNYKLVEYTVVDENGEERKDERVVVGPGYARDLFANSIIDISGKNAVDKAGDPIKCDEATLCEIYEYNTDFAQKAGVKISAAINKIRGNDLKNLKPGLNGTSDQGKPVAKSAKKKSSKSA